MNLIFHLSFSPEDPEAAHREKSPLPEEEEAGTAGEMQHCPETEDWIAAEQNPEHFPPHVTPECSEEGYQTHQ